MILEGRYRYHLQLTDVKTEALRGYVTCPSSYAIYMTKPEYNPDLSEPRVCVLNHGDAQASRNLGAIWTPLWRAWRTMGGSTSLPLL